MINRLMISKQLVVLVILVGFLLGGAFAGMMAFNGAPALAQSGNDDAGETEDGDTDDTNEGPDVSITGTALERASAAALAYKGEGRVTETEVGDEEGYYEVEITLDNGSQVDVHLDENFNVLGHEND